VEATLRRLTKTSKLAQASGICVLAGLLAAETDFALQCHLEQYQMASLVAFSAHRREACLELGWRWEADDQENQYKPGNSAGTHVTVGPISGFVMDVTEDEFGHAQGQCHALNAPYTGLMTGN
jgi:hypothetical protein